MRSSILLFLNIWTSCLCTSTPDNYCHREVGGQSVTFCCNNSEEKNGRCVECMVGFVSSDGKPCKKCPVGRYGRKCFHRCTQCLEHERCDHVDGCKMIEYTTTPHRKDVSSPWTTVQSTNKTTGLELSYINDTTEKTAKKTDRTTRARKICMKKVCKTEYLHNTRVMSTEQENEQRTSNGASSKVPGLLERELIIYSISAGGFFVVLAFCAAYYSYRLQPCKRNRSKSDRAVFATHRADSLYDSIDETNMFDENLGVRRIEHINKSDSNSSCNTTLAVKGSVESDGYLNPITTGQHQQVSLFGSISTNSSSEPSSDTDIQYGKTGCIPPYQSLQANIQEHKYTECQKVVHYLEIINIPDKDQDLKEEITSTDRKNIHVRAAIINAYTNMKIGFKKRCQSEMNIHFKQEKNNVKNIRSSI